MPILSTASFIDSKARRVYRPTVYTEQDTPERWPLRPYEPAPYYVEGAYGITVERSRPPTAALPDNRRRRTLYRDADADFVYVTEAERREMRFRLELIDS